MFAINNNELNNCPPVPDDGMTVCPACQELHRIEYGERINSDGSREPSKMLGYVKCGGKCYLVALDGKTLN